VVHDDPRPPRKLNDRIPRDLETVCLKAMAKEPHRRYTTAGDLAADLRRWLSGEAITARPIGSFEKAWRWARRHPTASTLIAASALALVGLGTGLVVLGREQARTAGEFRRAEDNLRLAHSAVDDLLTKVSENRLLRAPGLQPLRKELLEEARRYYLDLASRGGVSAGAQAAVAEAHVRLSQITAQIGSLKDAIESLEKALSIYRGLVRDHPRALSHRWGLARVLMKLGRARRSTGDLPAAEKDAQEATDLFTALDASRPGRVDFGVGLAECLSLLASLHQDRGDLNEAERVYRLAIANLGRLRTTHPGNLVVRQSLAVQQNDLGILLRRSGRPDLAAQALREAVALRSRLTAADPGRLEFQEGLARSYHNLGNAQSDAGEGENALHSWRASVTAWERLVEGSPNVIEFRRGLAISYNGLGAQQLNSSDPAAAESSLGRAVSILERLIAAEPGNVPTRDTLASASHNLARVHHDLGRFLPDAKRLDDAGRAYQKSISIRQALLRNRPRDLNIALMLAGTLSSFGQLLSDRGQARAALDRSDEAVRLLDDVLRRQPAHRRARRILRRVLSSRAEKQAALGRSAAALADCDRAIVVDPDAGPDVLQSLRAQRAKMRARAGDWRRAVTELDAEVRPGDLPEELLFDLARGYAVASEAVGRDRRLAPTRRSALAEELASRAERWLIEASATGGFKRPHGRWLLTNEPDLAALRSRPVLPAVIFDQGFPADPFAH
jgi:tetratricopeptide (TPR) repeat protein